MASTMQAGERPKVGSLLSGIADDLQLLFRQNVDLLRAEVKEDLHTARKAAVVLGTAAVLALAGGILLLVMLVHLLHWLAPGLPLWGCYGIVGFLVLAVAGGLYAYGRTKLEDFSPLPEQSIEALQENVECVVKQT